jgi:hypothetical protein
VDLKFWLVNKLQKNHKKLIKKITLSAHLRSSESGSPKARYKNFLFLKTFPGRTDIQSGLIDAGIMWVGG